MSTRSEFGRRKFLGGSVVATGIAAAGVNRAVVEAADVTTDNVRLLKLGKSKLTLHLYRRDTRSARFETATANAH